ncbi:MAG: flagellar protein FlgN [Gammaproteobacteria bacterium]|nr:flagellar protein FlgN [Gammaproteobacteria bacterium]
MSLPALKDVNCLFDDEQSALSHLQKVLEEESAALLDRDILAIESITPKKVTALKTYQAHVNRRLDFLLQHELEGSEQGLLTLIASFPQSEHERLTSQWHSLKQGFEDVIAINERNGIVIYHNQQRNRNLLKILHGGKNEPNLYNGSGAAQGHSQRQRLGEA